MKHLAILVLIVVLLSVVCVDAQTTVLNIGNLTDSPRIDLIAFAKFASSWQLSIGDSGYLADCDFNDDGTVDILDFVIFSENWLHPSGMVWVYIDDDGFGMKDINGNPISHGGFTGFMSKYKTTNAQYCEFLNAALASGDITVGADNVVYGADGSNAGADFVGEPYFETFAANSYSNIIYANQAFTVRNRDGFDMSNHPVIEVSWYGAMAFCNFYADYNLPTQWQWQAVADYDGSYIYGCGETIDHSKVNYDLENPLGFATTPYTSPVDFYASFGYGLNDMSGNVREWTRSVYSGESYILCGGSWFTTATDCKVAYRDYYGTYHMYYDLGFRVCR